VLGHARSGAGCGFEPAVGTGGWSVLYGVGASVAALLRFTAPAGDGAPTRGPRCGKRRPTGGTLVRIISEIKTLLNENSSRKILKVKKNSRKIRGGRRCNCEQLL
jgi:hypothetical protein